MGGFDSGHRTGYRHMVCRQACLRPVHCTVFSLHGVKEFNSHPRCPCGAHDHVLQEHGVHDHQHRVRLPNRLRASPHQL